MISPECPLFQQINIRIRKHQIVLETNGNPFGFKTIGKFATAWYDNRQDTFYSLVLFTLVSKCELSSESLVNIAKENTK